MLFFRGRNSGLVSESNQKNRESQSRYRPGVPSSDPDWRTGKKETVKVVHLFSAESEFGVGIGIESEKQKIRELRIDPNPELRVPTPIGEQKNKKKKT